MPYKNWFCVILILFSFISCNIKDDQIETKPIRFFVISDWGWNASENQIAVAKQMANQATNLKPEFILTCGDNFQDVGVTSVSDSLWRINYEEVYNYSTLNVPWYPALGNHDYLGNVKAEIEYSNNNWSMPAEYYSFTKSSLYGTSIQFIVIDTYDLVNKYYSLTDTTNIDSIEQIHWLKQKLAESTSDWIFVTGHYPVYSSGAHGNTRELIYMLKPIFEDYHVDFYICGHDHDFEHIRLPNENTEYIVTGTGGSTRPISGNSQTVYCSSALGFTSVSVSSKTAKIDFITADGDVAYSFFRSKKIFKPN